MVRAASFHPRISMAHLLPLSGTVYTRGSGGAYSTVAKSNLACGLGRLNPGPSAVDRAELAGRWRLAWDPSYTMPDYAQIHVDGRTLQVVAATDDIVRLGPSTVAVRVADVIEVTT